MKFNFFLTAQRKFFPFYSAYFYRRELLQGSSIPNVCIPTLMPEGKEVGTVLGLFGCTRAEVERILLLLQRRLFANL